MALFKTHQKHESSFQDQLRQNRFTFTEIWGPYRYAWASAEKGSVFPAFEYWSRTHEKSEGRELHEAYIRTKSGNVYKCEPTKDRDQLSVVDSRTKARYLFDVGEAKDINVEVGKPLRTSKFSTTEVTQIVVVCSKAHQKRMMRSSKQEFHHIASAFQTNSET